MKKDSNIEAEQIEENIGFGVVNVNRLRFRADKDINSKTLRYLDTGAIVTILYKDDKRVKIGEMEDYWYQIGYEGIKGWVFGYFLDIYSSIENAQKGSKKYSDADKIDSSESNIYYEDAIDKNLFFISNGRIYQLIDGRAGAAKILKTEQNLYVVDYFFINKADYIYYTAKNKSDLNDNGFLYLYNMKNEANELLSKNVYSAAVDKNNSIVLLLGILSTLKDKYWIISYFNVEYGNKDIKDIAKIKINKKSEILDDDALSMTLRRELGSLTYLRLDESNNFVYFKPPEENLTYLISILNGSFIQINSNNSAIYNIDEARYINVRSNEENEKPVYSINLCDKFSGYEKEILTTKLYPINMSISPDKNLLAISLININEIKGSYYSSSIYVLSLITNSLITISSDGFSYNPKWSKVLIK